MRNLPKDGEKRGREKHLLELLRKKGGTLEGSVSGADEVPTSQPLHEQHGYKDAFLEIDDEGDDSQAEEAERVAYLEEAKKRKREEDDRKAQELAKKKEKKAAKKTKKKKRRNGGNG